MSKKRSSPKKKSTKRSSQRSATVLLGEMQLTAVRLLNVDATLNIQHRHLPTEKIDFRVQVNLSANSEQGNLLGNVTVHVLGKPPEDAPASSLSIAVTHQAIFAVENMPDVKEFPKRQVQELQAIAANIVWPYSREFVNSITQRMGLPHLLLPLMRFDPNEAEQMSPQKKPPARKK